MGCLILKSEVVPTDGRLFMKYVILILLLITSYSKAGEFNPTGVPDSEIQCLALNIYHEARNQPKEGQVAIAYVTHNRMMDRSGEFRRYNTYCDVIHQGYVPGRRDCHFSWYCDGKSDTPFEKEKWEEIRDFAAWFVYNYEYVVDPTDGATHYHNLTVEPWWTSGMKSKGVIGDHLFWHP